MASEEGKVDHENRQYLDKLLERPRVLKPLADKQMKITLGAGNEKKTSVKEMVEEYKASEGGKLLLNGGKLTVPVTDYVKSNFQIKAVETTERMERELNHMYQELISKGSTEEEAKNAIKVSEKYSKYQKFKSEMAEVMVKEALEALNRPG